MIHPRNREYWLYSRSRVLLRRGGESLKITFKKHPARRVALGDNRIGIILNLGRLSLVSIMSPW